METPSRVNYFRLSLKYLWSRGLFTAVGAYFFFSSVLLAATGIDICIPCIWTAIFGVHCPGCGMTTAFIHMMKLDFAGAWESNVMAFLVLPAGIFFVVTDIRRFLQKERQAPQQDIAATN